MNNTEINPIVQDIRRRCRMAMNGDASAGMRKYGLVYKLNFGLMISQIRDIAQRYTPSAEIADLLWQSDTRELKILAGMLHPSDEFPQEKAEMWVRSIPNQEIREQLTINLLQKAPKAEQWAMQWAKDADASVRATAYWLMARLLMAKKMLPPQNFSALNNIWSDALSDESTLRKSAVLLLKHIGRSSTSLSNHILQSLSATATGNDSIRTAVTEELTFEFDFFAQNNNDSEQPKI